MKTIKKKNGGARVGAGRPARSPRVKITIAVRPATRDALQEMRAVSDISIGDVIDGMVGRIAQLPR